MSPFEFNEDIPLTVLLLKNDKPSTGETVTVRVVDDDVIALERLAETSAPETAEPGLYSFLWTNAPTLELNLVAIFQFGTGGNKKTTSEFFKIRETVDPELVPNEVDVFVEQDDIVSIDVIENDIVDVNVINEPIVDVGVVQDDIVEIDTEQSVVEILVECEG